MLAVPAVVVTARKPVAAVAPVTVAIAVSVVAVAIAHRILDALFKPRDAVEALIALLTRYLRDGFNGRPPLLKALVATIKGFAHGLRHRAPVQNADISRFYRHNFETFASPWWLSRPLPELIRALPGELLRDGAVRKGRPEGLGRVEAYYAARERYYPDEAATLEFSRT